MKKLLNIIWLFVFSLNSYSQADYFPSINEGKLWGVQTENEKTYNGSSLYGYINGGAELYKEYGFSALKVIKIVYNNCRYTVEIYRMNGAEEAFGIFSVSRYNCDQTPALAPYSCQTSYQLQICLGSFYINIINSRGKEADISASRKIAESLADNIKERSADFSGFFPGISRDVINNQAFLVKGTLGVMNGVPELSEFLIEEGRYTALVLKGDENYLVSMRFLSRNELVAFAAMHRWNTDRISADPMVMPEGEIVSMISENHLLVRIIR